MATVEERLAALEARFVAPLAAVPPITVGELLDVPAPGSPIASAWAQEVSNRIVHRFATVAAMNAWAAADGSRCYVTATKSQYKRVAGRWLSTELAVNATVAVSASNPTTAASTLAIQTIATGTYLMGAWLDVAPTAGGWGYLDAFTSDGAGAPTGTEVIKGRAFETPNATGRLALVGAWLCDATVDGGAAVHLRGASFATSVHLNGGLFTATRIGAPRAGVI